MHLICTASAVHIFRRKNVKHLSNTYKNRNQYIKRTHEDILAKELNKLVIVMSYMYKNYNSFNNFENINRFREFIIDTIEIIL